MCIASLEFHIASAILNFASKIFDFCFLILQCYFFASKININLEFDKMEIESSKM